MMITWFKHWLKPPVFDGDPQKTFRAGLLNIIFIAGLCLVILVTLGNLFDKHTPIRNFIIDFLFLAAILFFRRELFNGRIQFVGNGFLITCLFLLTIALASAGTISSPTIVSFMFIMIASGILSDGRGLAISILGSSLAVGLVALAQNAGRLPQHAEAASLIQWFVLTVSFGVAGWVVYMTQQTMYKALKEAETEIDERKRVASELQDALTDRDDVLKDLRTYQFEMDWQNSELSRMQADLQSSRDRYLDLYDLAPVGYCIVGQNGLILEANLTAANMLGIVRGDLLNKPFSLFCVREYQDVFYLNHRKLIATHAQQSFELQMLRMDGVVFWVALEAIFIPGESNVSLTRVVISDISDRKQAEAALKESEERFRLMFENHQAVMLLIDSITGQIMDANLSAEEFYGYPLSTLLSKSIFELNVLPPDQVKLEMNRAVQSEINYFVFPHRLANGDIRIVEVHSSPLTIREKSALFSIVHDITERKHLEDQLNQLAMTDGLTGIYNRRHFIKEAQNELNRSVHVKRPLALVLFDIDHFKQINDTYGHAAGDQVLLAFTKICQENIREIDVFARYGGDEFVMLLPETSRAEAFEVAERIRMALVNSQMEFESELISLTISSGISDLNDETDSFDKLIERADQALYLAKQAGRNVVMISNEPEPNR